MIEFFKNCYLMLWFWYYGIVDDNSVYIFYICVCQIFCDGVFIEWI